MCVHLPGTVISAETSSAVPSKSKHNICQFRWQPVFYRQQQYSSDNGCSRPQTWTFHKCLLYSCTGRASTGNMQLPYKLAGMERIYECRVYVIFVFRDRQEELRAAPAAERHT